MPEPTPEPAATSYRLALWSLLLLLLLVGLDLSSLDLALTRWFGRPAGFALRDHWLWSDVMHGGARRVAWSLQFVLLLAIWWPFGVLRRLTRWQRAHMFLTVMLILLVISTLKDRSATSCPWDLAEFGGPARYVSHWSWGISDGGAGRCFPAGHASAAFCFLPGYFWLRATAPRGARLWLIATLVAGFAIGLAQQVRGAHYLSHTLWTAWMCWIIAASSHWLLEQRARRGLHLPSRSSRQ